MSDQFVGQRRAELRKAVIHLRARGLNAPAKWAAEQLAGLPSDPEGESLLEANADEHEDDTYLLAKSYFDLKVAADHTTASTTRSVLRLFVMRCRSTVEWHMC